MKTVFNGLNKHDMLFAPFVSMTLDVYNEFTDLRIDGRRPNELRIIDAELSYVPGCTGSSHLCFGQTEVIAQVFGPSEGKGRDDLAEIVVTFEYTDFSKAPHSKDSRRGRDSEVALKRIFETAIRRELYPNSAITISITVIQDDGSCQATAINAAMLAILDAGVYINDFVTAVTTAYIADKVFLDAGRAEDTSQYPILELALFPGTNQIVSLSMKARVKPEVVTNLTAMAIDGCKRVREILGSFIH